MLQVNVILGDVIRMSQPVDAIATLVNSKGDWFSNFDKTLKGNCGHRYHLKLSSELERLDDEQEQTLDGKIYIIKGERLPPNQSFKDVIFAIDDSSLRLSVLIFKILEAAHLAGYKRIAIPPLSGGISFISSSNIINTALETKIGVSNFRNQYPESNMILDIVVDNLTSQNHDSRIMFLIKF